MPNPTNKKSAADRKHARRDTDGITLACYRTETARARIRKNIGKDLQDISAGGMRMSVTEALEKGASLTIELKEPVSGDVFLARGTVCWSTPSGNGDPSWSVGVRFLEVFTPLGKRDKFFYGRTPSATAKPHELPGLPDPEVRSTNQPVAKEERFQIDDYVVSVSRTGIFSMGRRRNIASTVVNLSTDGAQIECIEKLEKGAKVSFTLHLNKFADTFEAPAEVVWVKENSTPTGPIYFTGVVFGQIDTKQRKLLDYMMSWFTSYQAKYRKAHKTS